MRKIYRFTASWCQPCKTLAKILEKANEENIPIEVVDIDVHQELAETYFIRSVPTLVMLDEKEKPLKKLIGLKSESEIREWLK